MPYRPATPRPSQARELVGRAAELERLRGILAEGGPRITFVHGVAGVGKSSIVAAFAAEARDAGATVIALDGRTLEPTDRGVLSAIAASLGRTDPTLESVARALARAGAPVIVVIDHYEVLRLVDTWLRQVFVPRIAEGVRMVFAGREPPIAAWLTAPPASPGVDRIPLAPLEGVPAIVLFEQLGVPEGLARRLNTKVRGLPIAIRLAAAAFRDRPDMTIDDLAAHVTLDQLTRIFLADVPDARTRTALEAMSVVRRSTTSLLAAMLPDQDPVDALDRLRALPFVETRQDGVGLHDAVQTSVAGYLRATDPPRHRRYRRSAWRQLRDEVREAPVDELWRYTADMLFLIENPVVREAFFPSGAQPLAVEPARAEDRATIEAIACRHDGDAGARAIRNWYDRHPRAFSSLRDRAGRTVAFFILLTRQSILDATVDDPVVAGWREHLRRHATPIGQEVLGFRRWLDEEHGERPSGAQAAAWLDVKRTYMELRPGLRRIYTVVEEPATYLPIVLRLGFRPLAPEFGVVEIGDRTFASVVLDFGPNSVDGWLAGLVAAELGLDQDAVVDELGREVRANGHTIRLTPLEFGVLRCLQQHDGQVVSRATLLETVWGYRSDVGSNVVDVVVRRLREKLAKGAVVIETVRGSGYRTPSR